MNKITVAIAVLFVVRLSSIFGAEPPTPPFLATVTGTVIKQESIAGGGGARIRTSTLNNKRIFEEFNVSSADYALVVEDDVSLILLPKSAGSGKSTITVIKLDNLATLLDTKAHVGRFVSGVATSTGVDNLFEGLSGTAQGNFKFVGLFVVTKLNFNFIGRGSNVSVDGAATLLQFKVVSGKAFSQQP